MLVTKQIEIDMGHRVPNHKSKCQRLHGHRYKIEVGVNDKKIQTLGTSDEGMVIDFGDLKQIMVEQIDAKFDHRMVLYEMDPIADALFNREIITLPFIPTAENLAQYWGIIIDSKLKEKGIKFEHLKVWETPTSTATYSVKDYE